MSHEDFKQPRVAYGLRQGYLTERRTYAEKPPQAHSPLGLFVVTDPDQSDYPQQAQFVELKGGSGLRVTPDGLQVSDGFRFPKETLPTWEIRDRVFPLEDLEFRIRRGHPILYLAPYRLPLVRLSDQLLEILDPAIGKEYHLEMRGGRIGVGRKTPLGRIADTQELHLAEGVNWVPVHDGYFHLQGGKHVGIKECYCERNTDGTRVGVYTPSSELVACVRLLRKHRGGR